MKACRVEIDEKILLDILGISTDKDIFIGHINLAQTHWGEKKLVVIFGGDDLPDDCTVTHGQIIPDAVIECRRTVMESSFKRLG